MNNHAELIRSEIIAPPLQQEDGLGALTLGGYLEQAAATYGDSEAVCWIDVRGNRHRWTYRELTAQARKVAGAVLALGLGKNARIGILSSNRPEWLASTFGVAMAGGVAVALNTFSTPRELRHQLQHADIQLLILEEAVAGKDFVGMLSELCPNLEHSPPGALFTADFPHLRRLVCLDGPASHPGFQPWGDFIALADALPQDILQAATEAVSPVDPGLILFSSGSTAMPKAILHTHRAAALQCWRFAKVFEVSESSRALPVNGFFFSGNFAQAMALLAGGGCLVLQRTFNAQQTLQLLEQERITTLIAWPHQEASLMECPDWSKADLSCLRHVSFNSALRSHPTVNTDWQGYQAHGMTETFTLTTLTHGDSFQPGSFGTPLHGNIMRIVDPVTGDILPIGETGEILIKGPTTMMGYLKVAPEETFDREGFIHSGDAGYVDANGHLYWKGRLSEIIKTGGANVSPSEVDEVLESHPRVRNCCTVGIPDPQLGERVVACIVPMEGENLADDELRTYARQHLASYKVPRRIVYLNEDELPVTGSAKIRRAELREVVLRKLAEESL